MAKRTTKSETIVVRLEPQLLEYIEKIADSRLNKSAVVRRFIYEFYVRVPVDDAKQIVLGYESFDVQQNSAGICNTQPWGV